MSCVKKVKLCGVILDQQNKPIKYSNHLCFQCLETKCDFTYYNIYNIQGEGGYAVLDTIKNELTISFRGNSGNILTGVLYNIGENKYRGTNSVQGTTQIVSYELIFCP